VNELDVLLWAAEYGFSLLSVRSSPIDRTKRLQKALVCQTNDLLQSGSEHDEKRIVALWNSIFANLLSIGLDNVGILHKAALVLARRVYSPPPEWPEVVKLLGHVVNDRATSAHLEKLYESGYFLRYRKESQYAVYDQEDFSVPDTQFASHLLALPKGVLSTRWQKSILTSDIQLDRNEDIGKLEDGLKMLESSSMIKVKGPLHSVLCHALNANRRT